jgi:phosphoglycerate dehydrogenase-like enzyme
LSLHVWLRVGGELPKDGVAAFTAEFPGVKFSADVKPEDYSTVDVVFTNSRLNDDLAVKLTSLKWIQTTYGGGASYLTPSVVTRKIPVTCSRGVQAQPLSEFTEACVLALAKRLPLLDRLKQEHRWDDSLELDGLPGKVAGLLGFGAVGSAVAQRLHKHDMRIHAIRRNVNDIPPYVEKMSTMDRLPQVLAESDVIVIGLPPLDGLRGLIGEKALRSMKKTAFLINLVTRQIVDDEALATALENGWIAGAALNVFSSSPLPENSRLWNAPNLIISPNVASTDPQRWLKLRQVFTGNLSRYLKKETLVNMVDSQGAY